MARERAAGRPLLFLDAGGMFLKQPEDAAREEHVAAVAGTFVKALGAMGLDAAGLGRADLLLAPGLLRRLAGAAPFPFLAANVRAPDGTAPFAASVVKDAGGVKVGLVGITGTRPPPAPPLPGRDLEVADPTEAARAEVARLRGRCGLIVVLSSLGIEDDVRLAREVPGIDVILGSSSRALTTPPRLEGGTIVAHAGAKGMRVGKLELEFTPGSAQAWAPRRPGAPAGGRAFTWSVVELGAAVPDDPAVAALVEEYRAGERERAARDLAAGRTPAATAPPTTRPATAAYVGSAACGGCHQAALAHWLRSPHARAMLALVKKKQDLNPECLPCHVTAYDDPAGFRAAASTGVSLREVQCEACHGAGREHRGHGKIRGRVPEAVCRRCHTTENSPTFEFVPYLRRLRPHTDRFFTRSDAPGSGSPPPQ